MLEVKNIHCRYDKALVLQDVSLAVSAGEILCLMGRNGAGKTTTLKSIMGLVQPFNGTVELNNQKINHLPAHHIPRLGIGYIPQGRRLFSELSVNENLEIGLMVRNSGKNIRQRVYDIFPRLKERRNQRAETLSGGEQQMLATARALCLEPSILLLDEPTEGLQPSMIELICQVIVSLKEQGVAIILVEQHVETVLSIADRVTFIENGKSRETIHTDELSPNHKYMTSYVGV